MTAQLLTAELTALIQDTKRRHPDIRAAAEKSLADLKSLANTSESQLAADLKRRPEFVRPFLLSCKTGNPKYAGPSVASIQRLVVARGFSVERLEELLDALRECSNLGSDVQLRVLQIMPSLFQRHSQEITESRLTTALQICFVLQASKNGVISNTAAATLQQIISDVFTRITPDRAGPEANSPETTRVSWQAELDCHQVLRDLCMVAEGRQVKSLENANVSKDFAFELIGTILLNFTTVIPKYTNFVDILRQQLLPLILRIVSASAPYNSTVRALRIVPPIVKGFLEILPAELEMLLSMLTYLLEPDAGPAWKRVMCMETLREIYKESSNIRRAYALFDGQEHHKAIVQEQLSAISRLASEKPAVIGLGQVSTLPTTTEENGEDLDGLSALQADPLTATTGVSLSTKTSTHSGIGLEMSSVRVSLVDQLDKSEPPSVPQSYIYALALTSMNNLSESIARFILPFATSKAVKRTTSKSSKADCTDDNGSEDEENVLPTNPMRLQDHRDFSHIRALSALLEKCWPALLSTYSTFFQAALDPEFFHGAIRAFQKLIQVVTLLRLPTPRDAFLTSLAKQSLPIDAHKTIKVADDPGDKNNQNLVQALPRMSPRNLLCLRALLNLGIALGSVLDRSWAIVLNTLQQADIIIGHLSADRTLSRGGPSIIAPSTAAGGDISKDFVNEVTAVRSAASRMLNSSNELPNKQFRAFLRYLAEQMRGSIELSVTQETDATTARHQRNLSADSSQAAYIQILRANVFVIDAFAQIIDSNRARIAGLDNNSSGWDYMVQRLMQIVAEYTLDPEVRIAAADAVCKSVVKATTGTNEGKRHPASITYGLSVLRRLAVQISSQAQSKSGSQPKAVDEEIHSLALQTLKGCLDHLGESITDGWEDVFELILSAFSKLRESQDSKAVSFDSASPLSRKLLRSSFSSLETVCSDVIEVVPYTCLLKLLRAIFLCCRQTLDINIGLTATSLYQNVSDSIWSGKVTLPLDTTANATEGSATLAPGQLWVQILVATCETSVTEQSEIRNNAVHACFQIVSGVADHLTTQHWSICLHDVFLRLYLANHNSRSASFQAESTQDQVSLDDTAASIHTSLCELIEEYPTMFFSMKELSTIWPLLTKQMSALLDRHSLSLSASVLIGLRRILDVALSEEVIFTSYNPHIWDILLAINPWNHTKLDRPSTSDNQSALTAYMACFTSLYKVSSDAQRRENLKHMLGEMRKSLAQSTPTNYVNDLAAMTPLQAECVRLLDVVYDTNDLNVTPIFLNAGATLVTLPHRKQRLSMDAKGPTFVAFSSATIKTLGKCLHERCDPCNLHKEPATSDCLEAFRLIISHKATWKRDGQNVTIWRDASSTAIEAAWQLTKLSKASGFPENSFRVWKALLTILDATLDSGAEHDSDDIETLASDLSFDIDAFERLFALLVPNIGSENLPDEARQKFAETLMLRSLIHEPHPDDSLEPPDEDARNGQWLQAGRIGRVRELPPSRRSRLCYILTDRLFNIVSGEEQKQAKVSEKISRERQRTCHGMEGEENRRIAVATMPYLLLRIQLVLKAYISDQPLRGRMPCPLSQKRELHHLLNKSVELARASQSVHGQWPALRGDHLALLKQLGVAALRATLYDEKSKEALLKLIEV